MYFPCQLYKLMEIVDCDCLEKRISHLLDKEDEEMVVEDSFDAFQKMYKPILDENFKDIMQLRDGKFYIDSNDKAV